MVWSQRPIPRVQVEKAPLVFVGYGVTAPERGWDDFKGVDLKDKIAVFLINDPDFEAAPTDPVAGKFGGKAATYYGRWMYKFEEAARRGALGAIIVHETAGAAYPWSTVVASNGDSYDVVRADAAKVHPLLQGWIQRDLAVELFKQSGLDFEAEKVRARTYGFRPVELKGAAFSADFAIASTRLTSHNVLAKILGASRDPTRASVSSPPTGTPSARVRSDATGDTVYGTAAGRRRDRRGRRAGDRAGLRLAGLGSPANARVAFGVWTAEERGLLGQRILRRQPPEIPPGDHRRQLHHGRGRDRWPQPRPGAGGLGQGPRWKPT